MHWSLQQSLEFTLQVLSLHSVLINSILTCSAPSNYQRQHKPMWDQEMNTWCSNIINSTAKSNIESGFPISNHRFMMVAINCCKCYVGYSEVVSQQLLGPCVYLSWVSSQALFHHHLLFSVANVKQQNKVIFVHEGGRSYSKPRLVYLAGLPKPLKLWVSNQTLQHCVGFFTN